MTDMDDTEAAPGAALAPHPGYIVVDSEGTGLFDYKQPGRRRWPAPPRIPDHDLRRRRLEGRAPIQRFHPARWMADDRRGHQGKRPHGRIP